MKIHRFTVLGIILGVTLSIIATRTFAITSNNVTWSISPYPNDHNFAFTIINDVDGGYSKRLAPLFDTFDNLGLRITTTAFCFTINPDHEKHDQDNLNEHGRQSPEFFGPENVPLTVDSERLFYKQLSKRGHEIGMHSPSRGSDTRQQLKQGFEYFRGIFGSYPKIYVEHDCRNNKEAQSNEGADPSSAFYCTDLLNQYGSWIWIDGACALTDQRHEKFYDILAADGSPFNEFARKTYGIVKGFIRSGKWENSTGEGFLQWYSKANIDDLEKNRGLALVYTHLDRRWLDRETRRMREPIRQRLEYLVSKDGWFVPASVILDRFQAMKNIFISYNEKHLKVINANSITVEGFTLISHKNQILVYNSSVFRPNKEKEIIIGTLKPFETKAFNIIANPR